MRRLAVVGTTDPAGQGQERRRDAAAFTRLRDWVATLPTAGVLWLDDLAAAPLAQIDLLWIRGAVPRDQRLSSWLAGGGRLLATHDGVLVIAALALERAVPAAIPLPDPLPPEYGLAGFGAHPLFTGLRDGAVLGRPIAGGTVHCFEHVWPAAAVVAVERRGFEVDSGRVIAWEYRVGEGGALCLGLEPPLAPAPGPPDDAEILLANALVGDAIPHRDRVSRAAVWPRPGRRALPATLDAGLTGEPGSASDDDWPPSKLIALDLAPSADWAHAGRRLIVRFRAADGERDVWAPPVRVMHAARMLDAIACAPGHIAADGVTAGLALRGHRLSERWLAAADAPVAVWEIGGPDGVEVTLEWSVDLSRAWPFRAGAYGDLTFDAECRSLRVRSEGGPHAWYAVSGGALSVEAIPEQPGIRVSCTGTTPLRVTVAAGIDGDELARAMKALGSGVRELAASRARKAAQLDRYGTAFDPPDPLLARGFAWARQRGDEALIGAPGIGRSLLTACPRSVEHHGWCFGAQACDAAAAQLIAGDRDPARELLKFLAQSQRADGGVPVHLPIGGLASRSDAASTAAFLRLAERLLAWTGDLEAFRRIRGGLSAAVVYLAGRPAAEPAPSLPVLDGIEALVEDPAGAAALTALRTRAAPDPGLPAAEAHAVVEAAAASLRRAPGALVGSDAAPALLEAVGALWGLAPDAPDGALAVAAVVPEGWEGHALRGLRVGRSVLDLDARRRPGALIVRVAHRFGPRLVLTVRAGRLAVETTEIDDVLLPGAGGRARFETHDRHEVRFHLAG